VAALAGVAVYIAAAGGRFAPVGQWLAAAAAIALALAIAFRVAAAIPWTVALAGAGYVIGRIEHATVDGYAAAVGVALLLAAELAAWAADHDRRIREERPLVVRQLALLGALLAVSLLVGFVLVGAAGISASAGVALTVVGVAAAVGAVGLIVRLLRVDPGAGRRGRRGAQG
jgi:hypothetical protein